MRCIRFPFLHSLAFTRLIYFTNPHTSAKSLLITPYHSTTQYGKFAVRRPYFTLRQCRQGSWQAWRVLRRYTNIDELMIYCWHGIQHWYSVLIIHAINTFYMTYTIFFLISVAQFFKIDTKTGSIIGNELAENVALRISFEIFLTQTQPQTSTCSQKGKVPSTFSMLVHYMMKYPLDISTTNGDRSTL